MADLMYVSQNVAQAEWQGSGVLVVSQNVAQAEWQAPGKLVASQLVIQVEYVPTYPDMSKLMRHGKWFNEGIEQPFWFAR